MEFTGESFVPSETVLNNEIGYEHLHRYISASALVKDKIVLDIACGKGYGSLILAENARTVTGVDIDAAAIKCATDNYTGKTTNCTFICSNVTHIPVGDNLYDVIISFDTIEHLNVNTQAIFLKEIKRVLRPGGILIISTPNKKNHTDKYDPINKFNSHEFYSDQFKEFLKKYFLNSEFFEQGYQVTSIISSVNPEKISFIRMYNSDDKFSTKVIATKSRIAIASDESLKIISKNFSSIVSSVDKDYLSFVNRMVTMNNEIEKLGNWAMELNNTIKEVPDKHKVQTDLIDAQANSIIELNRQNAVLEHHKNNDTKIQQLTKTLANLQSDKKRFLEDAEIFHQNMSGKNLLIYKLTTTIDALQENHKTQLTESENFQQIIQEKNLLLEEVNKKIHQLFQELNLTKDRLSEIYSSDGWRLLKTYYNFKGKWLPEDSKLYKNLKKAYNKLRFKSPPKTYEGVDQTGNQNNFSIINNDESRSLIPITLPIYEFPAVSIIIPAYNAWAINYQCINSIIENTQGVAYEVIIADDCSTDITKSCETIIKNLLHIRTAENVGFLKNCNNAAKFAKGKYILFLNNDTKVNSNWLSPLVNLIESDDAIGMVGSKFIYPDGQLQEAGGIIWQDASGWNYGHKQNPQAPEFNYVKEVDYISGACILINKEIWEKAGGFDEMYSPAYCEDSDLAFTLRSLGYKVMYQPLSEIIHYEGYSHGTTIDENAPTIKAYQKINNTKFREKWKDVLQSSHLPNAQHVFKARDKSINKKTILVIDHYVPHYDKDAGSKTMYQYLQLFVSLGLNIKFIGDNFYKQEPYTTTLQQMGIEVLYGNWYYDNWKQWIKDNSTYIDFIFINRPHISIKYIDFLKENTTAKILYYGHDLHFLREEKQYEVQKDVKLLDSAAAWKKTELYLFEQSDIILTPSDKENEIIAALNPAFHVETILPYFFKIPAKEIIDFTERKTILFVGGFAHTPNLDAVEWFCKEVWPLVIAAMPELKFEVVGSHPPEAILQLQSDSINIKGFVSETELETIYKSSRIAVIPLRYGAGVKGKTIEAMYYGIPIVSTSFGIEGMPGNSADFLCAYDTAVDFVNKLINLYTNEVHLKDSSLAQTNYINQYFTQSAAAKKVKILLDL